MCCILYKPKGVQMVSLDILDKIKRMNHDGYGFVSTRHSFKSMNYDRFLDHLSRVNQEDDCIIHFRFATHGSKCRRNCHPFVENGVYFAHNGILSVRPTDDMTDSETAFRELIYPLVAKYGFDSREVNDMVRTIIGGSRFAMMYKGVVRLYGNYFKLNDIYYSNLRWL